MKGIFYTGTIGTDILVRHQTVSFVCAKSQENYQITMLFNHKHKRMYFIKDPALDIGLHNIEAKCPNFCDFNGKIMK